MGRKKKVLAIEEVLEAEENVAALLREETLDDIGHEVCQGFDKDKSSRKEWEERNKDTMKLALQVAEKKTWPWENASNVKHPGLTLAAIQFAARVDLFNGEDVVQGKILGSDPTGEKADRAIRIKKHMGYQLTEQMPNWMDENDVLYMALSIGGAMFKKTFHDPVRRVNRSDLIHPHALVFDYWAKDVESAFRKTHVLDLTPNMLQERIRSGVYLDVDLDDRPPSDRIERELAEDVEGMAGYDDDDMPRKGLEQHRFLDLDDDGYKEPYVVTVDKDSEKVLRITPRFDSEKIKRNGKEINWIDPIEYFTQFKFIPDPSGGNLGIGFGRLQGHLTESASTAINMLIDAGTLANTQGGFISKGIRLRAGEMNLDRMGEWKTVMTSGVSLKDGILPLPTKEPSQVLFLLLQMLVEGAERVGSITDAMVGEAPNPNTPATSTLATLEQGLKVFKSINKRLYRAHTKEFKKLYELNRKYLDKSDEYFEVVKISAQDAAGLQGEAKKSFQERGEILISRKDYEKGSGVIPSADPNADSKMEKTKKVEGLVQTMPLGWPAEEVKKRYVEAMDIANPDALLAPQPSPPPPYQVQVAQMKMQGDQAKMQADAQVKMAQLQLDQKRMELDGRKLEADVQKMQMEMAKMEAEIRQILAEVQIAQDDRSEKEKAQLEVAKTAEELKMKRAELEMELEMKKAELDLKREELGIKREEMQMQMQMQGKQMMMQKEMEGQKLEAQKYGIDKQAETAEKTSKDKALGDAFRTTMKTRETEAGAAVKADKGEGD